MSRATAKAAVAPMNTAHKPTKLRRGAPLIPVDDYLKTLATIDDPAEVIALEKTIELAEKHMHDSGLYSDDDIRRVNELRMRARWKLGRLLALVERGAGPGRGQKMIQAGSSFSAFIESLGLPKTDALRAQRIGAMPEAELEKALAAAHRENHFATFAYLLDRGRPFWYAASRRRRHQIIHARAIASVSEEHFGPFPLIYADPPWKFEVYSPKGLERTPDQHYPTMSDEEIALLQVGGRSMLEIAATDAALFLWCTSSNLARAREIMSRWNFEFKTSAVWVKDKAGLGLVFRNQHELILYGTRGNMPGPQYQPSSVFAYPRGRHSAKPPQIRAAIERMYPDFDEHSRLELFARDTSMGWTCRGFEASGAMSGGL
jgi:N6-adenosine-specific RNA methylase IME4